MKKVQIIDIKERESFRREKIIYDQKAIGHLQ